MKSAQKVTLSILGTFSARYQDTHNAAPPLRRKSRALLAYLIVIERPCSRRSLAEIFCQQTKDPMSALRSLLSRIRRQLRPDILLTERKHVQFNPHSCRVDYSLFSQSLDADLAQNSTERLETAVNLYRGELLSGLSLPDAPEFEIWLLGERARLRHLYENGLAALTERFIAQGQYDNAISRAQQLVQSSPLREEMHGRLIWLYARTGQREAALRQFEKCRDILLEQLAVEPAPELQALYQQALAGQLKTINKPVPDVAVADLRQTAVFVGREPELTQLQQAWRTARLHKGGVVLLEAEAGGGKTRLVEELSRSLPEVPLLVGECYESARSLPYSPWIECLETRLSRLNDTALARLSTFTLQQLLRLLPSLAQRLNDAAPLNPPAGKGQTEHLFTAVTELLFQQPGFIFIDNLQWADEATLELFHFVGRRISRAGVLLIGAFRTEEAHDVSALQTLLRDLGRRPLIHLKLAALSPAAIGDLTAHLWPGLPEAHRPRVAHTLHQAAGGNPFFITELLRELATTTTAPDTLPVPDSVRDLVQRRLSRLPGSSRQVIEAAAVLDAPATPAQVQQTSGRSPEETVAAIDLGLRRNLLRPVTTNQPVRYEFSHDLVREAIVTDLSDIRRRLLHRRTAETLEQSGAPAATLAFHWARAGDLDKEGHFAGLAGEEAAAVFAFDEAVRYLQRALDLVQKQPRRIELMIKLSDVQFNLGQWLHVEETLNQAMAGLAAITENTEKMRWEAKIRGKLGNVWLWTGDWSKAEESFRHALALAEALDDSVVMANLQGAIGQIMTRKGLYPEALSWLTAAYNDSKAAGDKVGMARHIGVKGIVYYWQDEIDQAAACYEEALWLSTALNDQPNIAVWLANIGTLHHEMGKMAEALTYFERALEIGRKIGFQTKVGVELGNIGDVHRDLGDYVKAINFHLEALLIRQELGEKGGVATILGTLAEDYEQTGKYDAARHCLLTAWQIDVELENRRGLAAHLSRLGRVYYQQNKYESSLAVYDRAIILFRHLNSPSMLSHCLIAKAAALLALQQIEAAVLANSEGLALAEEADKETAFTARLLAVRLQAAGHELAPVAACRQLESVLPKTATPQQRAAVQFEQWRLDKSQEGLRQQTAVLYRHLYADSPKAEYRQRHQELTGDDLPQPPLPPPPEMVTAVSLDHSTLLTQADQLIAKLNTPSNT